MDHNFYSKIDKNDICRIILGYAPFGKAIVNSVAYSLQYLKRVVWDLYENPKQILSFDGIRLEGTETEKIEEAKKLLDEYCGIKTKRETRLSFTINHGKGGKNENELKNKDIAITGKQTNRRQKSL